MLKGQLRAGGSGASRHHTRCSTQQRSHAGSRCVMSSCQQAQIEVSASTSPAVELGRRQLFLASTMVLAGTLPARADPAVEAVSSSASATLAASAPDQALDTLDLETMPTSISSPASEPSSSPASPSMASTSGTGNGPVVYLDVKLEGKPLGRVAIQLFDNTSTGAQRFRDLAIGKQGVGYRLSRFDRILPTYIRCEGVKSLSYSATMDSPITGGDSLEALEEELQAQTRTHGSAGLVSLVVAEENQRPIKEKLIAKNGKLITITQQAGEAPNGTTFMITRAADPALDATNLIVGRVVQGMEVVEAIGALPFARPRDSYYDSPFFSVAKAIGDKRADTAEKGFNRPLKRVIVSASGLADST